MKQASYKAIGFFVLISVALAVGLTIFFGGGQYFSPKSNYVMFFEGSIGGLRVGAPVTLNGVTIGRVYEIKVQVNNEDGTIVNPVFVELEQDKITDLHDSNEVELDQSIDRWVARGLRSQLRPQSIVTGLLFVELSFNSRVPARYRNQAYNLREIPTAPSPLQEIKETIDSLRIQEIFVKLENTLVGLDRFVNSTELSQVMSDLRLALQNFGEASTEAAGMIRGVNEVIKSGEGQFEKLIEKITVAANSASVFSNKAAQTLEVVSRTVGDDSKIRFELAESLKEVSNSARSLRELAEFLKRNPNALVVGKKN